MISPYPLSSMELSNLNVLYMNTTRLYGSQMCVVYLVLDRKWRGVCVWTESQRPAGTWPQCRCLNFSTLPQSESEGHTSRLRLGFYSSSQWWEHFHTRSLLPILHMHEKDTFN